MSGSYPIQVIVLIHFYILRGWGDRMVYKMEGRCDVIHIQ